MEDRSVTVPHDSKKDSPETQAKRAPAPMAGFDEAVTKLRQARSARPEIQSTQPGASPYMQVSNPSPAFTAGAHPYGNGSTNPADLATLSSTLQKSWPRDANAGMHQQQQHHPGQVPTRKEQQKLQEAMLSRFQHPGSNSQTPIPMPTASYAVPLEHSRALGKTALKAILEPGTAMPVQQQQQPSNAGATQTPFTQTRAPFAQYIHAQHQQQQPQPVQMPTETQYAFAHANAKSAGFPIPAGAFQQLNNATPMFHPDLQTQVPLRAVPVPSNQQMPTYSYVPSDISQMQQQQRAELNAMLAAQFAMQNASANHGHIMAGVPPLDAQGRPLTSAPTRLGSRTKRDREHSTRKLDKLPKQTRRHVNVKVEPNTASLQPVAGIPGGLPIPPNSPLLMTGGSLAGLVPPMGSPVMFGKEALMHSLPMLSGNMLGMPPGQGRPIHNLVGRGVKQRPDIAVNTRVYNKSKNHVSATPRRWTKEEDDLLRRAVKKHQEKNWKAISNDVPGRNHVQCLQRWRKALDPNVVKGHWTTDEDQRLLMLVAENPKNWGHVARGIPGRTAKQCRERYHNHLDPSIKKGDWTEAEDTIIIERQQTLGNKWAEISKFLPGRTENSVKIRWKSIQRQSQGAYHSRRAKTVAAPSVRPG